MQQNLIVMNQIIQGHARKLLGGLGHVGIPLVTWVTQSRTHYSVEFTKDTDY